MSNVFIDTNVLYTLFRTALSAGAILEKFEDRDHTRKYSITKFKIISFL